MQWFGEDGVVSGAFSAVGEYFEKNQWASDALAGGAAAGLNYMAQKDEQEFQRRETDKAWDRKMHLAKAPDINMDKYHWNDLASGSLTDGGLIAGGMKK